MAPRGVIWLATLGAASRRGVTQDEISRIVQFLSQPGSGRFSQKSFLFYDNFPPKSREILDVVLLFSSDSTIVMAQKEGSANMSSISREWLGLSLTV